MSPKIWSSSGGPQALQCESRWSSKSWDQSIASVGPSYWSTVQLAECHRKWFEDSHKHDSVKKIGQSGMLKNKLATHADHCNYKWWLGTKTFFLFILIYLRLTLAYTRYLCPHLSTGLLKRLLFPWRSRKAYSLMPWIWTVLRNSLMRFPRKIHRFKPHPQNNRKKRELKSEV